MFASLPSIENCNPVNLTDLYVEGLPIPYRDLANLLFLSVPHLVALELSMNVVTGTDTH